VSEADDPTAALLWAACRPEPDVAACEEARSSGADLGVAAQLAVAQRISGLLWRVVRSWSADDEQSWDGLRRDVKRCEAQATLLRPRLADELLRPLNAAGLMPLVFKGPAIAARYPKPGLRPMDDIDLVLPADQRQAAIDALSRVGWDVLARTGEHYEVVLVHPALPGLPVELHVELDVPKHQAFRLRAVDLWHARQPTTIFGVPAYGMAPETELVALATHAAKPFHVFQRLLWSVDIAVLIGAVNAIGGSLDWDRVDRLARQARARAAVAVALNQAARLGAESPERLRHLETSTARRRALGAVLDLNWPTVPRDVATTSRLPYALVDDPLLRVRLATSNIFAAGPAHAPERVVNLTWRAGRRWWTLRR